MQEEFEFNRQYEAEHGIPNINLHVSSPQGADFNNYNSAFSSSLQRYSSSANTSCNNVPQHAGAIQSVHPNLVYNMASAAAAGNVQNQFVMPAELAPVAEQEATAQSAAQNAPSG